LATRFFLEGNLLQRLGLDDRPSPPWIMVPLDGKRNVTLAEGAKLKVALRKPGDTSFCGLQELQSSLGGRVFELSGLGAKTVFLDAVDASGATKASLEISVKTKLKLATFFGFVFDSAGRVTPRGFAEAMDIIKVANTIMTPQANVEMFRKDSGAVRLPFEIPTGFPADLGAFSVPKSWARGGPGLLPCISSRPLGPQGCMMETTVTPPMTKDDFDNLVDYQKLQRLVSNVNAQFDYNIFFVKGFSTRSGFTAGTGAYTPRSDNGVALNLCVMPDVARGRELAHELCHFLLRASPLKGPGQHSNDRRDLMFDAPGLDSVLISKDQANVINPSGKP
jgi:hypothetical protein